MRVAFSELWLVRGWAWGWAVKNKEGSRDVFDRHRVPIGHSTWQAWWLKETRSNWISLDYMPWPYHQRRWSLWPSAMPFLSNLEKKKNSYGRVSWVKRALANKTSTFMYVYNYIYIYIEREREREREITRFAHLSLKRHDSRKCDVKWNRY